MPITPDRLSRLREFGLSEYAARAYLALLDLGVAEARDVSTLSKVPQAKIYHVLEQLHEKGLAVILPEFPKKYAPVPFAEYLDRIHEEHQRAASAIDRDREILAEMFRVMGDMEVGNRGFFTVVRGRRNVLTKIEEMLGVAKSDVFIMGTTGFASRYQNLMDELDGAKERGARLRALVPHDSETIPKLEPLNRLVEIRDREIEGNSPSSRVALLLVDDNKAFLINFLPDDDNVYAGKDIGVFTDQEAMVAALASLAEPRWSAATPWGARIDQMRTGRPAEFTRAYLTPEEATAAFRDATARGFAALRANDSRPASAPTPEGLAFTKQAIGSGSRVRAIVNVADREVGEAIARSGADVRHAAPRLATRYWCLDEREAFFSVVQPGSDGAAGDVLFHTTNPAVVRSLVAHFDEAWSRATTLDQRRKELAAYPDVHPRDLGFGRLFEETHDAILVADAEGRLVLWNARASEMLGIQAGALVHVSDVLPDATASFLDATTGARFDAVHAAATRSDGTRVDLDLRIAPIPAPDGRTLAMGMAREAQGRRVGLAPEVKRVRDA